MIIEITIFLGIGGFLVIFYTFSQKYMKLQEMRAKMEYSHVKRKLRMKEKRDSLEYSDDDDDDEGVKEVLPSWLSSIAQGAGIDEKKLLEGDNQEINKALALVKNLNISNEGNNEGF